jgi:hypothetical protein
MEDVLDEELIQTIVERRSNCSKTYQVLQVIRILIYWGECRFERVTPENEIIPEYLISGGSLDVLRSTSSALFHVQDRSLVFYALPVKVQALRILWRRASQNMNGTMRQSTKDALMLLWEMDEVLLEARRKMIEKRL